MTNNGHLSSWFSVERSCHQGCPIAPYLMLCCGEAMAHFYRAHSKSQPLTILEYDHMISQFADDTQFMTQDNANALEAVTDTLNHMTANIGFQVNEDITQIFGLGGAQPPDNCPYDTSMQYLYLLGVDTNPNSTQLMEVLEKSRNVLNDWRNRSLTLTGKISVINTLVGSLFGYIMQVVPNPSDEFYEYFNCLVKDFL